MTVLDLLASGQGFKGSEANIALAKQLSVSNDTLAIKELVENLNNKDKNVQSDCIKTLYELGYLKPELIASYYAEFIGLLTCKNNRLVWGSMIALATIVDLKHDELFSALSKIMEAVGKGSVITIDNGVEILSRLNKYDKYFNITDPLLAEQLWKCPIKQLPMYIEKVHDSVNIKNKEIYQTLIEKRLPECELYSQAKRLEESLKRINKI
jgi:hypothetical protein